VVEVKKTSKELPVHNGPIDPLIRKAYGLKDGEDCKGRLPKSAKG